MADKLPKGIADSRIIEAINALIDAVAGPADSGVQDEIDALDARVTALENA